MELLGKECNLLLGKRWNAMNAVEVFKRVSQDPKKTYGFDLKKFMNTGVISIGIENLTDQEKEDLSHLRMDNTNGTIFDDRERKN